MSRLALVFERQWLHLGALVVLVVVFQRISQTESFEVGSLWGLTSSEWAWLAIWIAVAHQVLVWFCWRTELHLGWLSSALGDGGFVLYGALFAVLGISRTVAVWLLAFANQGTLDLSPWVGRGLALLFLPPAIYLFYSVSRYFGFRRALGADHFDPSYRDVEFVRQGIFRYTRNGMYTVGFLILWVPGLWWGSVAALWVALFNHLYIWVHFYATEKPDMQRIYSARG